MGELPELMRILSLSSPWPLLSPIDAQAAADVHTAVGEVYELLGEPAAAAIEYRAALTDNHNVTRAHLGLARLSMPGPDYRHFLALCHQRFAPTVYLEIGVARGHTLALARPPTVAIGIDPEPRVEALLEAETHVYRLTSDAFFAGDHPAREFGDRRVAMAFIDGLHHFEQALRDFANVERWAARDAVVLVHDTYPLDEITQRRERETDFWTGDVWKFVACLRELRRELDVITIATPPAGLTVIRGLDPGSSVLTGGYEATVAHYMDVSYGTMKGQLPEVLNLVPGDPKAEREWLASPVDRA